VADTARRRVRRIAFLVVALLGVIVAWTVLADRYAPGTSRGAISAYVAQIGPRVPGRVTEVAVADNAVVEPGAALFSVDERPYEIAVERARVQLEQAAQAIQASSAQLASAQAQVAKARSAAELANDAAARTRTLHERRLDADENTASQANAALAAAEASAESARQQLGSTGAENTQIRTAELALEQAQYDLISTTVTAPRRGVVTNLHLTPGQFAAAGTPLLTFIDADAVWITADLRENQLLNVDPGDTVSIAFDADPGRIYAGTVESIAWGINPGRNEVGGLPVNAPSTQWFEPARRMPVRITLDGGIEAFPKKARLGGKVSVLIHAEGASNPVSAVAGLGQRFGSLLSALY
jgi:multidrug resistance efflux pump